MARVRSKKVFSMVNTGPYPFSGILLHKRQRPFSGRNGKLPLVPGPKFLSVEQVLLTTLVVKITIIAALATILVRYHRFRHILISERRAWPDRLTFSLSLGIPLAAAAASRLLLNYNAADLTLEGAFLAGLIAGPYAGAIVGLMVAGPALLAGGRIAPPLARGRR